MIEIEQSDAMVPLRAQDPRWVRMAEQAPHRSTAFRHATLHRRPGLWGNHPDRPSAAVWLREGADRLEAFGAGRSVPAVAWLASRCSGKSVALLAPPSWEGPIRLLGGHVEVSAILTFSLDRPSDPARPTLERPLTRRITLEDARAFAAVAPAWALQSWSDFEAMLVHGAAFGVPMPGGFASVAWTYESDPEIDKIGVATRPRYQNLSLGRAAAGVLIRAIVEERRKLPLWTTTAENAGSIKLAGSLGFVNPVKERLIRWTPADPRGSRPGIGS
jgi:hypothetical protein